MTHSDTSTWYEPNIRKLLLKGMKSWECVMHVHHHPHHDDALVAINVIDITVAILVDSSLADTAHFIACHQDSWWADCVHDHRLAATWFHILSTTFAGLAATCGSSVVHSLPPMESSGGGRSIASRCSISNHSGYTHSGTASTRCTIRNHGTQTTPRRPIGTSIRRPHTRSASSTTYSINH
jgi:hypothetical protein